MTDAVTIVTMTSARPCNPPEHPLRTLHELGTTDYWD